MTLSGSISFIRPLSFCLVHPGENKAIEVVDISPGPCLHPGGIFHFAPFANINQGPGQSTVDSLSQEEQAVSGCFPEALRPTRAGAWG